jgi:hypothetical protein
MIDTRYNVTLYPHEGPTTLQVEVDGKSGAVKMQVFTELQNGKKAKSVFTFESDTDLKTIQEIIKWARVKSLQAQGFKVVQ